MAYILSIETCGRRYSVAVHKDGKLVACLTATPERARQRPLATLFQPVVAQAGLSMEELEAIAVVIGPGSYTGVRIGVAAAKALCYGLGVPLVTLTAFQAVAVGHYQKLEMDSLPRKMAGGALPGPASGETRHFADAIHTPGRWAVLLDAGKRRGFLHFFDANGQPSGEVESCPVEADYFTGLARGEKLYLLGSGVDAYQHQLRHPSLGLIPEAETDARYMGEAAYQKWQQQEYADLVTFIPPYWSAFPERKLVRQVAESADG